LNPLRQAAQAGSNGRFGMILISILTFTFARIQEQSNPNSSSTMSSIAPLVVSNQVEMTPGAHWSRIIFTFEKYFHIYTSQQSAKQYNNTIIFS
jgi:hypothetical protein